MEDSEERKVKVEATREPDTKNKRKYLWKALGLSGGIYIDKSFPQTQQPTTIVVKLKED